MEKTYCPKCKKLILITAHVAFIKSRVLYICGGCGFKFYKDVDKK